MFKSAVQISCSNQLFKSAVQISCSNQLFKSAVQISCSNQLFKSAVQISCSNQLFKSAVQISCLNQLFKSVKSAESAVFLFSQWFLSMHTTRFRVWIIVRPSSQTWKLENSRTSACQNTRPERGFNVLQMWCI